MDMTYFNAEKVRDELVAWLKDWFAKNGPKCKAVIGISGGKDSTIVAGVCVRAIGKDRVLGVLMPNGVQKDIDDSVRVCESLGIEYITVNIGPTYKNLCFDVQYALGHDLKDSKIEGLSEQTLINMAPRLRMTTLYAVSQTVGGRVINTSNKSEAYVGYFTRWGDECGDVKPIINLTKSEVVAIGLTMDEIPRELVEKVPTDCLTGKSDEDKLGFTYDELDAYLRPWPVNEEVGRKIESRKKEVLFKSLGIASFNPYPL